MRQMKYLGLEWIAEALDMYFQMALRLSRTRVSETRLPWTVIQEPCSPRDLNLTAT